jgi:hypothetical protein
MSAPVADVEKNNPHKIVKRILQDFNLEYLVILLSPDNRFVFFYQA